MEAIYEDVLANYPEMSGVDQVRLAEEIFRDLDEPTDEEMMASFGTKWHDGL